MLRMEQFTASPACFPRMPLEPLLDTLNKLGFRSFELFADWAESAYDWHEGPTRYAELGEKFRLRYTSVHLPQVRREDAATLEASVQSARFAEQLGAEIVIFKAKTIEDYTACAKEFLDRTEGLAVTPVITNHTGTAITTLEDYAAALEGIADVRMKALLEVGHFHKAGIPWRKGLDFLKERTALIHIKDLKDGECVEYGAGDVDIQGLFSGLREINYSGRIVVEVEGMPEPVATEHLRHALRYFATLVSY